MCNIGGIKRHMADRGGQGQILALRMVVCRCWLPTLAGSSAFAATVAFAGGAFGGMVLIDCLLGIILACAWGSLFALGDGVPGYAAPVARVDAVGVGAGELATFSIANCSVALSAIVQLAYLMHPMLLACDDPWFCRSGIDGLRRGPWRWGCVVLGHL